VGGGGGGGSSAVKKKEGREKEGSVEKKGRRKMEISGPTYTVHLGER
jgi:hypothetical protein